MHVKYTLGMDGETLAHLEHLRRRGRVTLVEDGTTIAYHNAVAAR